MTLVKYLFSVILTLITLNTTGNIKYICIGMIELAIILLVTELLYAKYHKTSIIFNDICMLLYNIQMAVLFFGSTYVQLVMLSNLGFLQDLSGKAFEYGFASILVLICSVLPVKKLSVDKSGFYKKCILTCLIAGELICIVLWKPIYSPFYSYIDLVKQEYKMLHMRNARNEINGAAEEFLKPGVADNRSRDKDLVEKPNIILLFVEGLSQNIVDDERDIMPNLKKLQSESLTFTQYYNHTFATLRGLIGQLYSGYQLDNLDKNNLVSLQQILKNYQYQTAFINTEPFNEDFTEYLQSLEFGMLIGDKSEECYGPEKTYSDKQAFELLCEAIFDLSQNDKPFFISMYTFGTHVTYDSVDEKYGDGSNALLNKFFNLDVQLGDFIQEFKASKISENTILVVTTDHATYVDNDFTKTFPDYSRENSMCDEIPLSIYYKGIKPEYYDAEGRNSLGLAPTILDYIDISEPNFFLGNSLFSEKTEKLGFDTIFNEEAIIFSTDNGIIKSLNHDQQIYIEESLKTYFAAKLQESEETLEGSFEEFFNTGLITEFLDDNKKIEINYYPEEKEYKNYWFAVWSEEDGQDDLYWYEGMWQEDGSLSVIIDLEKHLYNGTLNIHLYGGQDNAEDYITNSVVIIN